MKPLLLDRRQLLRASGAFLSLPFLPSLHAANKTAPKPSKRLVLMYVPNGLVRRCFFPGEENGESPGFVGNFEADKLKETLRNKRPPGTYPLELTSTMEPLAPHVADITLVTGLDRSYKAGQDVHAQGASCYLTSISPSQATTKGMRYPQGRSLDQVIADQVGLETPFRSLEISCNGFKSGKEDMYFDNISWYGPDKKAPSIRDPRKLYERLFSADSQRSHVRNVTDLLLADARDLQTRINREDGDTVAEYMEMLRAIEVRMQRLESLVSDHRVVMPAEEIVPRGEYIRLMGDLMVLALQSGLTNVCTFMVGPERWDAPMLYEGVFDKPVQHHGMTHSQKGDGYKALQKIDIFHMQQYAYLIEQMKRVRDADGSSLLDNTLFTYGAGLGDGATHQYFDLPLIVAGSGQKAIKQGRTIQCRPGTLNSNMWLTLANLMGLEIPSYADSESPLSQLWT